MSNNNYAVVGSRDDITHEGHLFIDTVNFDVHHLKPGGRLQGAVFHIYRGADFVSGALVTGAIPISRITTDSNGLASFYGLPVGSYVLREVVPPAGYVVIEEFNTFNIVNTITSPYMLNMTVTNRRTFDLPLTGGMGAVIFTVTGLALLSGGIVWFVRNKKQEQAI